MLNKAFIVGYVIGIDENKIKISIPYKDNNSSDIIDVQVIGEMFELKKSLNVGNLIGVDAEIKSDDNGMFLKANKITFVSIKDDEET